MNATQIHDHLIRESFIPATVSVDCVQRFIRHNDLKAARNPNLRDRKAYEEDAFGKIWQADTCYLPDDMASAYILFDDQKFPIRQTNRNDNCHTKRNNLPAIDYSNHGLISKAAPAAFQTRLRQSAVNPRQVCGKCQYGTIGEVFPPKSKCGLHLPQCAV